MGPLRTAILGQQRDVSAGMCYGDGRSPGSRHMSARRLDELPSSRSSSRCQCAKKAVSVGPRCPACSANAGPMPAVCSEPPSSACGAQVSWASGCRQNA